jgi:hypothetical protein
VRRALSSLAMAATVGAAMLAVTAGTASAATPSAALAPTSAPVLVSFKTSDDCCSFDDSFKHRQKRDRKYIARYYRHYPAYGSYGSQALLCPNAPGPGVSRWRCNWVPAVR